MILHLVNAAPGTQAVTHCLTLAAPGDAVLLMGDGTYCSLPHSAIAKAMSACGATLYVLADDAAARGLAEQVREPYTLVDMEGFVDLTERYQHIQSWY